MLYCTQEDIEIHVGTYPLIQLSNDDASQDNVNATVVEDAIIYSSTLIDGYLRGIYSLPLNTHFPLLRVVAVNLSIYRLYSRRINLEVPETIYENYKNSIKTLENIKKGVVTLETENSELIENKGDYKTNKTETDRLFNKRRINEY